MPEQSKSESPRGTVFWALILVQVLFAINYVVSKYVVFLFPPLVWAWLRTMVTAVILVSFALILKRPFPRGGRLYFVPMAIYALFGAVINQSAFLVGLSKTSATNSAILNTTIPLFTVVLATLRGQEKLTLRRGLGFLLGLVGVLVLRKIEDFRITDATFVGDMLMLVNCSSYAIFLVWSKSFLEKQDPVWATAFFFIFASFGIGLLAAPEFKQFSWPALAGSDYGAIAFAILGATVATYFLNSWALGKTKSSSVALYIYIQPAITSVLAFFVYGTAITARVIGSFILILMGMLLAQRQKT